MTAETSDEGDDLHLGGLALRHLGENALELDVPLPGAYTRHFSAQRKHLL